MTWVNFGAFESIFNVLKQKSWSIRRQVVSVIAKHLRDCNGASSWPGILSLVLGQILKMCIIEQHYLLCGSLKSALLWNHLLTIILKFLKKIMFAFIFWEFHTLYFLLHSSLSSDYSPFLYFSNVIFSIRSLHPSLSLSVPLSPFFYPFLDSLIH